MNFIILNFYVFIFYILLNVDCQNQIKPSKVVQRYVPIFSPSTPFLTQESLPGPQFGRPSQPLQQPEHNNYQQKHFRHHHSLPPLRRFVGENKKFASNEQIKNENNETFPQPINSLNEFAKNRGILINKIKTSKEGQESNENLFKNNNNNTQLNLSKNEELKKEREAFNNIQQKQSQNVEFIAAHFPINNETIKKEKEENFEKWNWKNLQESSNEEKENKSNEEKQLKRVPLNFRHSEENSKRRMDKEEEEEEKLNNNNNKENYKNIKRLGRNEWENKNNKQKFMKSRSDEIFQQENDGTSQQLERRQGRPIIRNEQLYEKERSKESLEQNHPNSASNERWSNKQSSRLIARRPSSSNSREEIERSRNNFRVPNNNRRDESQSSEQQINRRHPPPPRSPPLVFSSSNDFKPPRRIPNPAEFFPGHIRDGFPPFPEPLGSNKHQRNEK